MFFAKSKTKGHKNARQNDIPETNDRTMWSWRRVELRNLEFHRQINLRGHYGHYGFPELLVRQKDPINIIEERQNE